MARDYKNTKSRGGGGLSGVAGFVLGLGFGLAVAMAVYLYDRRPAARLAQQQAQQQAGPVSPDNKAANGKPAPASQDAETQFDFYEMLPKFEVVIPEKDGTVAPRTAAGGAVQKPGAYILQAGSFRNAADADRVRAQIALQG